LRSHLGLLLVVSVLTAFAVSRSALAQNYLLPNAPGKAVIMNNCERCHSAVAILHKRSPRQWNEIIGQMIARGANVNDQQRRVILAYLDKYFVQANDYVPQPRPRRASGPGLTLALEAAKAAEKFCENEGHQVAVEVADSAGATIVLLTGNGIPLITQADARSEAATVLRFKEASGLVAKRMETDPTLAAEARDDPEIGGKVFQGGVPIIVNGELIGAIAVSGSTGPAGGDAICARAGLKRIQAGLRRIAP
jgi:uncharacterized protein GlcG (DUF336 family)